MKKLLLTLFLVCSITALSAQEANDVSGITLSDNPPQKTNTRGRKLYPVDSYNIGIEVNTAPGFIPVNFVYEYNCASWFSVGGGIGLVLPSFDMSIFGRVGFTAAPKRKVSPFLKFDCGLMLVNYGGEYYTSALVVPTVGVAIRLKQRDNRLSVGLGFYAPLSLMGDEDISMRDLSLRVGYTF